MLEPLIIEEAVNGVINLKDITDFATAIISVVPLNPHPHDEAEAFIGKGEGEDMDRLGTVEIEPGQPSELRVHRNVLLKYSTNTPIWFYYDFIHGENGNPQPSDKTFYRIVLA